MKRDSMEASLISQRENLVARTPEELARAYDRLSAAPALGCDTETTGFSAKHSRLLSVQFSDGDLSVLVPVSEGVALGPLRELLANPEQVKILHNAKFDLPFLRAAGCSVRGVFDTMVAERLLTRGADQSSSLAETLYRYFAVDLDKTQRAAFTSKSWDGHWRDELIAYALRDVVYLPELMHQQAAWLERLGLTREFARQMQLMLAACEQASRKG